MYYRPAEWQKKKTIWLAWPFDEALWTDDLKAAQEELLGLVDALADEHVTIIFPDHQELERNKPRMSRSSSINCIVLPYGDIWLRDTFPIFVKDSHDSTLAIIPTFNGWGNKYLFTHDVNLAVRAASLLNLPTIYSSLVFEGGSIDCDGLGTLLTTEQCLLNKNRNPNVSKESVEKEFKRLFSAQKVIWIKEGLTNDHTDGHIDTIARFIAPRTIAIMTPKQRSDPNYDVLCSIKEQLNNSLDADGNKLTLVELPSPCAVLDRHDRIMPASYLNFIMGDQTLIMPLYGTQFDDEALAIMKDRVDLNVIGLSARAILTGGGAFHCISQEYYH